MKDFLFGSYCTEYSATIYGLLRKEMSRDACFSEVFRMVMHANRKTSAKYKIIIHRGYEWGKTNAKYNACLLTPKELRCHIDQLKGIIPFDYTVKTIRDKEVPKFEIDIEITDGTGLQHRYLLAWVRYAYEYPFNMILVESRKLRSEKEFKFLSGFNLFNIVGQCFNLWRPLHSIAFGNKVQLIRRSDLHNRLLNNKGELNGVFNCDRVNNLSTIPIRSELNENLEVYDVEFWLDSNLYTNERLPIYKKRLKYLRKQ